MSAAKAELAVMASVAATRSIFFMRIPIRFISPISNTVETTRLDGNEFFCGPNLESLAEREKPKWRASAAFLGVLAIPERVVS
jgi:hypothetical protein